MSPLQVGPFSCNRYSSAFEQARCTHTWHCLETAHHQAITVTACNVTDRAGAELHIWQPSKVSPSNYQSHVATGAQERHQIHVHALTEHSASDATTCMRHKRAQWSTQTHMQTCIRVFMQTSDGVPVLRSFPKVAPAHNIAVQCMYATTAQAEIHRDVWPQRCPCPRPQCSS